jgi:AcrR family transcriptional regulator
MPPDPPNTRAEQRRRTRQRILTAARIMFAETGYERTTIRAIARSAHVDPGLVTYYFGTKGELFHHITRTGPDLARPETATDVAALTLAAMHAKLTHEPTATLAMLRSMLTYPNAADEVRLALGQQQQQLIDAMDTEDAALRTGIAGAITLGMVIGRHLLKLDGLADADPDDIIALLRPCIESLIPRESPAPNNPSAVIAQHRVEPGVPPRSGHPAAEDGPEPT